MSTTLAAIPYNASAEAAVIGSVMFDTACWEQTSSLSAEDFYHPLHQTVWAAIRALMERNMLPDIAAVMEELAGTTAAIDHEDAIIDLLEHSVPASEAIMFAKIVADTSRRRQMIRVADSMRAAALGQGDGYVEPATVMAGVDAELDTLRASLTGNLPHYDFGTAGISALDDRQKAKGRRIPTGFSGIDERTGGFEEGTVTILAARTSMGKSTMAVSLAANAMRAGATVGYFSLEMSKETVAIRGGAYLAYDRRQSRNVRYADVLNGKSSPQDETVLRRIFGEQSHRRMYLDDRGQLTPSMLSERYRAWEAEARRAGAERPRLIVVDHLGNMRPDRARKSSFEEVSEVSKGLLAFAKRHNVAVLALSQLNRESDKDERRPKLSDLRQSGEIEEDAHAVMFLWREEYYAKRAMDAAKDGDAYTVASDRWLRVRNSAEIIIAKNRNGPLDTVHLGCDMACNAFWQPSDNVTPIWERTAT